MKKLIVLYYLVNDSDYHFEFDRHGDIVRLYVDGVNKSQDGQAIDDALNAVALSGRSIQADLSAKMDKMQSNNLFRDDMTLAKNAIEQKMERGEL